MLAHLTALLTLLAGIAAGGVGAVVALLVPFGMYLYFRERSPYVAFQALQATVFQAAGGILFVISAILAGLLAAGLWVLTAVLIFALVGMLLVPFSLTLTLLAGVDLLVLAVVLVGYPLRGAYLTYACRPFEYPWIGELVARTLEAQPVGAPASTGD